MVLILKASRLTRGMGRHVFCRCARADGATWRDLRQAGRVVLCHLGPRAPPRPPATRASSGAAERPRGGRRAAGVPYLGRMPHSGRCHRRAGAILG
eukprot:4210141-Prymnesium_polylepis.1